MKKLVSLCLVLSLLFGNMQVVRANIEVVEESNNKEATVIKKESVSSEGKLTSIHETEENIQKETVNSVEKQISTEEIKAQSLFSYEQCLEWYQNGSLVVNLETLEQEPTTESLNSFKLGELYTIFHLAKVEKVLRGENLTKDSFAIFELLRERILAAEFKGNAVITIKEPQIKVMERSTLSAEEYQTVYETTLGCVSHRLVGESQTHDLQGINDKIAQINSQYVYSVYQLFEYIDDYLTGDGQIVAAKEALFSYLVVSEAEKDKAGSWAEDEPRGMGKVNPDGTVTLGGLSREAEELLKDTEKEDYVTVVFNYRNGENELVESKSVKVDPESGDTSYLNPKDEYLWRIVTQSIDGMSQVLDIRDVTKEKFEELAALPDAEYLQDSRYKIKFRTVNKEGRYLLETKEAANIEGELPIQKYINGGIPVKPRMAARAAQSGRGYLEAVGGAQYHYWNGGQDYTTQFRVNMSGYGSGIFAFCINSKKATPPTGAAFSYYIDTFNELSRKVLYYGYAGPEEFAYQGNYGNWDDNSRLYKTHIAVDYAIHGYRDDTPYSPGPYASSIWSAGTDGFINWCAARGDIPRVSMSLGSNSQKAYVSGNMQRTKAMTMSGPSDNHITISLPSYVSAYINGEFKRKGGSVVLYGGQKIYFTAPLGSSYADWNSGDLWGSKVERNTFKADTDAAYGNVQDLGGGIQAVGNNNRTNFSVDWMDMRNVKAQYFKQHPSTGAWTEFATKNTNHAYGERYKTEIKQAPRGYYYSSAELWNEETGHRLVGNTPDFDVTFNANVRLHYYATKYKITYSLNGGSVSGNPVIYTVEDNVITLNHPVRKGYTFQGWTGSNGAEPQKSVIIPKGSIGNRAYQAIWKEEIFQIQYDLNDKTGAYQKYQAKDPGNPTSYTVESKAINLKKPVREKHKFLGWTGSNGTIPQQEISIVAGSIGSRKYLAEWEYINSLPVLNAEDIYLFREEELTEEVLFQDVQCMDEEDGNIKKKVQIKNLDEVTKRLEQIKNIDITKDERYEIPLIYTVTDSLGATVEKKVTVFVFALYTEAYGEGYIRFISKEYVNTLQADSIWKGAEMMAYLMEILNK